MVMNEMKYAGLQTIGNVAERVGVSLTTLRLLEAQAGVLPYRTDTNLRLYDEAMVEALCAYRQAQRRQKAEATPARDEPA